MKNRIAVLREESGLSQTKFAKKYRLSTRTLQNWEQGKSAPPDFVIHLLEEAERNEKIVKYIISYANTPVMKVVVLGNRVIDDTKLTDKDYLIPIKGIVSNQTFFDFLESRCYENGRVDLKKILSKVGMESNNPYEWIKHTHGAVYEDCWWIKEEAEDVAWDMIKVKS